MAKKLKKPYSIYTKEAAKLMGNFIRIMRKEQKLTILELAQRADVSRGLLNRIEKGDLKVSIGSVFEVATILGISLFEDDKAKLSQRNKNLEDKLLLLPKSIHKRREAEDDF